MQDGIARMGEVVFSNSRIPELRALGLGSCIGMCVFDPVAKLACLAHIMLPQAKSPDTPDVGKYADTAIPYVLENMVSKGAVKSRLRVAIVGGAQLFSFAGAGDRLDVGRRNTEAVKHWLSASRIRLVAEETGGKSGRTVLFDAGTGEVTVKSAGGEAINLVNLAS